MSHTFSFQVANVDQSLSKVKSEMLKAGYKFSGDSSKGSFAGGGVEGDYQIAGNTVTVNITKKPFVAPKSLIEKKIKEYFA